MTKRCIKEEWPEESGEDDLDKFMNQLEAGAMETVTAQKSALYTDSNTNRNRNRNTTVTNKLVYLKQARMLNMS